MNEFAVFVHPQSTGAGAEWAAYGDAELISVLRKATGDTKRRIIEELDDRNVTV